MAAVETSAQRVETPPIPSMEDASLELDAAVLQAKQHCIDYTKQQKNGNDSHVKRYLYAITVMRKDRFFSLHSGRRSRSLTRVYIEQREDNAKSAPPALPKKSDFAEEDIDDGSIHLEWHETIEGRRDDVLKDDEAATEKLKQRLPTEYHQWQHDVRIEPQQYTDTNSSVIWRVGDHLFSYEEPLDLSVDLPDKVHYFFTGEHLPEKNRRYTSLPNLTTVSYYDSFLSTDHSHPNLYGHGFRSIGTSVLSRTMENLDESRLQMGARPSLHGVETDTNKVIDQMDSHQLALAIHSTNTLLYRPIPITVFEKGSRRSTRGLTLEDHNHQISSLSQESQIVDTSNVAIATGEDCSSASQESHYAVPESVHKEKENLNESAAEITEKVAIDEVIKEADNIETENQELQIVMTSNVSSASQESHYAVPEPVHAIVESTTKTMEHHYDEPSVHKEKENLNESTLVHPPSPTNESQQTSSVFAAEFTEKLVNVNEAIKEAIQHIKKEEEPIYHEVYEERIYDEVADERHTPPPPVSPIPTGDDTLHYAAVAIATGEDNSHLYKDDENIYEEIDDKHIIESTAYAEPHIYEAPKDSAVKGSTVEHEYAEVAKEKVVKKTVESVSHYTSIREKFESHSIETNYKKSTAPKRKDFDYDENGNDEILVRTPEFEESASSISIHREVKPYVGSPTFNKLQKKFYPEDLAKRQAQRESLDHSVLNSPTTIVTNNGVTETEYRAYDKNQYDEASTLVIKSPIDQEQAKTTLAIRRMSRNNHWSEDDLENPRGSKNLDEYIPPNSPFVKVSPTLSPRASSVSPVPAKEISKEPHYSRPADLNLNIDVTYSTRSSISPVDRVVSSEIKSPSTPIYESGFVKERRKIFENGAAPPLPGVNVVKKSDVKPYHRTPATVRLETTKETSKVPPVEKTETVEVKLRKTNVETASSASHTDVTSNRRKSVLEMRKEYEASLQHSETTSTTSSPQRSRANSRRRTGEVQIGSGVALTITSSKPVEEEVTAAKRTVHRTIEKAMKMEKASVNLTASVGEGVTISIDRGHESPSTSSLIGSGASVRSPTPVAAVRIGASALPTSQAPPPPVEPTESSVTVEFPLTPAAIIKEARGTIVEEEPIPLQRNGSGRRSWTVKTYENNIRFDNQKLKMPDIDYATANGHLPNGVEKMNGEENAVLKDWDPRPLVRALYAVSYEPRIETKRNRFFTMEGHVEVPSQETNTVAELEREWKSQYMRAKEGRLQIFASHAATDAPAEEIVLSGCDVDANREERTLTVHGGQDKIKILLRVPSAVFDKWRQALLSHAASSQIDAYVKPISRTMDHLKERVAIIEIGSCSIRGGRLTQEPSLPQSFFPAIAVRTDDGKIIVGEDAFTPQVRHRGDFVRPIQASDPAVERYTMDKEVVKACMNKVVSDLQIDPTKYKVLLSIPQKVPIVLISELVTIALQEIKFQGAAITQQPSLILYAYDVTTGVVVDIGDRLNIVPVIDGYVVDSAICSIPYGATQVREALRSDLCANNKGLYSFQSPIEKLILRYVLEQSCYVPEDYQKEEKSGVNDVNISLDAFNPTPHMPTKFSIDSSRFTCTEGLFRPKKWGLDTKGLHQLIHDAVQMSPIDARRTLYRNIYLAGGASLLPGLAEKLEQELANIVPNSIHTQVHISPWRYNAAYLGAQVVASSSTFEDKCVTSENLQKFLFNLSTSNF